MFLPLIVPAIVLSTSLAHAPAPTVAGNWKLVAAPDLETGIARATASMPTLDRARMQARLRSVNPVYQELHLKVESATLSVGYDHRAPVVSVAGEPSTWTREDGQTFFVTARLDGRRLVQTIKSGDGERVNEFVPTADGKGLTLLVTVKAHEVPGTLQYRLIYTAQ